MKLTPGILPLIGLLGAASALPPPSGSVPSSTDNVIDFRSLSLRAAAPIGTVIDRKGWKVSCNSQYSTNQCAKAIDGNKATFWHTLYGNGNDPKPPHTITVDMGSVKNVNGISMLPRQDGSKNGFIAAHQVFVSVDGKDYGSPVAYGTWYADNEEKFSNFEPKKARYVRLVATSEAAGQPWTSIAELNVYQSDRAPVPFARQGQWGVTLDFPIVPVAGAFDPVSEKVVVWSSWAKDEFTDGPSGITLTSIWDPKTGAITQRKVDNTQHDMFCPGISMGAGGEIIVTGGNGAKMTSFYNPNGASWVKADEMWEPRGYHSSATCSDGRVFTIGGSWSGGEYEKDGEVYDPKTGHWLRLPNAPVKPMLTKDPGGIYRSDNHAWLFGWKNGTVLQAGPSTNMHWYYTGGNGDIKTAGKRGSSRGDDPDAMCGNAVMYDAVAGKILTFGGATAYENKAATTNAHILTVGQPGTSIQSKFASNGMWYPRTFHNSVVLPDGTVFIAGGQEYGVPFADTTPQLTPELYDPERDQFFKMQPNSIVRVYHSLALLLPDATVFVGGGGLCGSGCNTNHFDAQIFKPQYLLDKDGKAVARPEIKSVSGQTARIGSKLTVTTNSAVAKASLVRYGSATHTVDTDQRRIPLTLTDQGSNKYAFTIPNDSGIALPGYWMLFVLDKNGVPSVAKTIKITV